MLRLATPWMLALTLAVIMAGWLAWRRRTHAHPRLRYSSTTLLSLLNPTWRSKLTWLPTVMILAAALLCALAMTRPQSAWRETHRFAQGIAIMLVLDVSDSMRALDFTPDRLEKSKQVVKTFIDGRSDDLIGLAVFAKNPFTLCPLTQDYAALRTFIDRVDFNLVDGSSTAIGMGLAIAVDRLRNTEIKSKVVILLTDGENNSGKIDPISAAEAAKALGVRVYTIGVGSINAIVPLLDPISGTTQSMHSSLDVEQLTKIAEMTGGQFFHAKNDRSLEEIYRQIDQMERTKVETNETHYFDELSHYLMLPALFLLILALGLEQTWLRRFP